MSREGADVPKPHERLAEAMNTRRLELRLRWNEVASLADISPEALRSIRRGDYRPSQLTAQALDRALQWESGSTETTLDGGEPTPIEQQLAAAGREPTVPELAAELAAVKAKNMEIERRLREIEGRGRQRKTGS